jgi:hypothetical protein
MAYTKSGLYVHSFQELQRATALTGGSYDVRIATNFKIALLLNTATDGAAPVNFSSATPNWSNASEAPGTGWTTGGILLSVAAAGSTSVTPTIAEGTTGSLRYDHTNDVSVASTTVANFQGHVIYCDLTTAPADLADWCLCSTCFTGGPYTTSAGTLGIQWAATGIYEIDMTP